MPRGFGRFLWWLMAGYPLWYGWGFRIYPPFYLPPWYFHPWFYNPYGFYPPYGASSQDYLAYLKEEEKFLIQQLEALRREIAEVEKEIKK